MITKTMTIYHPRGIGKKYINCQKKEYKYKKYNGLECCWTLMPHLIQCDIEDYYCVT